jgi:hypothetical protein
MEILIHMQDVLGRAVAQAVSPRLPTTTNRVRCQARKRGICGGQNNDRAGSLRVFRLPLPTILPLTAPYTSSSTIWGCYNKQNSDRRTKWIQSRPTQRIDDVSVAYVIYYRCNYGTRRKA